MRNTRSNRRKRTTSADLAAWLRANSGDNNIQLDRMRRNLRLARERELTPRQREVLTLYYDGQMSVTAIAQRLGVNASTVSRTLKRAQERLRRSLRYSV